MKKNIISLIAIALIPACTWFVPSKNIQGSGVKGRDVRDVSLFDTIEVSGHGTVIFTQGDDYKLVVETDDNLLQYIKTDVHGNDLELAIEKDVAIDPHTPVTYYVTGKKLTKLELEGATGFQTESLKGHELKIEVDGSSKVVANIDVKKLNIEAHGATNMYLEGTVKEQTIQLEGASHYDAGLLTSQKAHIEASGSSRVTVNAIEKLYAKVSGSTFLGYKGEPMLTLKQSGSASISNVG